MTTIWISEFNWHRLRRKSITPSIWAKLNRCRFRGRILVQVKVDPQVLAHLARLDSDPDKAITIAFEGFTTTQFT